MVDLPDIKAPNFAALKSKKVLVPVVIGGAALALYLWYRNKQQIADATTTDPTIDPATGLPYAEETGLDTGLNSGQGSESSGVAVNATGAIVDIPGWTAAVVEALGQTTDPGAITAALGDYLARIPLTADEAVIVREAWALEGYPPGGPTTYTLASAGTSSPGGSPPVTTPPPTPAPPKTVTPTPPAPKPPATSATSKTKYVTVVAFKSGQAGGTPSTLSGIVEYVKTHYGVSTSVAALQKRNGLGSSTVIHPGQHIYYA